ncbi:hypothetical protein L9F63_024028, partial [Diploptera punctata]
REMLSTAILHTYVFDVKYFIFYFILTYGLFNIKYHIIPIICVVSGKLCNWYNNITFFRELADLIFLKLFLSSSIHVFRPVYELRLICLHNSNCSVLSVILFLIKSEKDVINLIMEEAQLLSFISSL